MSQRPTVFVHTNDQQMLGALLAAHSFRRSTAHADRFDIKLLRLEETPHLHGREGRTYLRMGKLATWHNNDLQSFSPLRRMVPQLMGYQGRALVTDPDVFSVGGDVWDLLSCNLGDKALLVRGLPEHQGGGPGRWATSVMAMDCSRLTHWRWDAEIDAMFSGQLDYKRWIQLADESPALIDELPEAWNSLDKLEPATKLLHTTERLTQPWKTGLPVDFNMNFQGIGGRLRRWLRDRGWLGAHRRYRPHPDPAQERFFFDLLKDGLERGVVDEAFLRRAVENHDVRPDVFQMLERLGWQATARA